MIACLITSFDSSRKLTSSVATSPVLKSSPFVLTSAPSASIVVISGVIVSFDPPLVEPMIVSSKFQLEPSYLSPLWIVPAPNKMFLGVLALTPVFPALAIIYSPSIR